MTIQTVGYKAKEFKPLYLVFFFLIAFGLTWFKRGLLIFGILNVPAGIGSLIMGLLLFVLGFGPMIAAFVVTAITEGKPGVRALWRRFWNRNMSLKWLLVTLLFYPALVLVANIVSRTLDRQAYPLFDLPNPPWMLIISFLGWLIGSVGEEFGWRGYALPHLQARWNALVSSIVLGILWAAWQIPLWFNPGDSQNQKDIWGYALYILLLSILMTWIFNNTKGSVLAAVLFHAMANTVIIWCCGTVWQWYGVLLLAVICIVVIFGARNLVRQHPEKEHDDEDSLLAKPKTTSRKRRKSRHETTN